MSIHLSAAAAVFVAMLAPWLVAPVGAQPAPPPAPRAFAHALVAPVPQPPPPPLPPLPVMPPMPPLPTMPLVERPALDHLEYLNEHLAQLDDQLELLNRFNFDVNVDLNFQSSKTAPPPAGAVRIVTPTDRGQADRDRAESLYRQARALIDQSQYERAITQFNRLADLSGEVRADAALYWKAYAQAKLAALGDSLATLSALQKQFTTSAWIDAARALEVEVKQAAGQSVSPDLLADEDLKLLALRGLMQTDPDRALPMVQQVLAGNSSVRVKENALFVLSQSRAPRARDIIAAAAKGGSNPDVQLTALRYLGAMRGTDNQQLLDDIYRSSSDEAVKRAVLEALHRGRFAQKLGDIARIEKDVARKRSAVRYLGSLPAEMSSDLLKSLYQTAPDVKRDVVNALSNQRNAAALVELARAEKDQALKKDIVSRLSTMRSKEATDYMLELLK